MWRKVEMDSQLRALYPARFKRKQASYIVNEATIVATNVHLTPEFAKRRRGDSKEEAKNHFKTDVFYVIA